MYRIAAAMIVVVFAAAACSGTKKAETTEEAAETVEATVEETETKEEPADQGEGIAWEDKSHDQQKAYMKMTVKPRMEELFQGHDAEAFAEFRCTTCHGESAKKGEFEMPSADLPTMDFERWKKDHPEDMEFMKTKVVPQMAEMLGMEPYDPETQTGFGCGACHPSE